MTHDRIEHDSARMTDEPSYEAGYTAGLAGEPTPRHFNVLLEQVLWADGWHAGMAEAARRAAPTTSHAGRPGLILSDMGREPLDQRKAQTLPGLLLRRIANDWVVVRYGVQTPQYLSLSAKWDYLDGAAWFADKVAAHAALCPPGTTGIAVQMSPATDEASVSIVASVRKAFNEF